MFEFGEINDKWYLRVQGKQLECKVKGSFYQNAWMGLYLKNENGESLI